VQYLDTVLSSWSGQTNEELTLFYKVLDIALWIVLLILHVVVSSRPWLELETRNSMCNYIKTSVEKIVKPKGTDILLNKAKEELLETQ
jgi:hypothetical protein